MYHILTADDDAAVRAQILSYAEHAGYAVTEAANGGEALELCRRETFDAVLLDVNMPGMDGFSVCMELRRDPKTRMLPILFVSSRAEEYDRVFGFELGCDDYVVKPFSPRELMLRVAAVIRRYQGSMEQSEVYRHRSLSVNLTAHTVDVGGVILPLSPKEFALLQTLIRHKGVPLERERLISEVWGDDFYGDTRTLDTHIKRLRRILGEYGSMIVTMRGIGYRFDG